MGTRSPSALEALLLRLDDITAAVIARSVLEIPEYRLLPAQVVDNDLVGNVKTLLELFLCSVVDQRAPTEEELAMLVSWGAERARDGLPLGAVQKIYPIGAREVWDIAVAQTPPEQQHELLGLVGPLLAFLGAVIPRVASGYLLERDDLDWENRESRQMLAARLLAGRPAHRQAERAGRSLAERYDIAIFQVPETDGAGSAAALFRAIQAELDTERQVLARFERDGGILLVPFLDNQDLTSAILARIDKVTRTRCLAAAAAADSHDDIPRAHREAGDVLHLAEQLRRRPGLYRLADLAVEYQLAQPGPARASLAGRMKPLLPHPHLIAALRAFVNADHNRGEAARALNIHRNTLNYRLNRIHLISGYDPTDPAHAQQLAAALTAYDVTTPHPIRSRPPAMS